MQLRGGSQRDALQAPSVADGWGFEGLLTEDGDRIRTQITEMLEGSDVSAVLAELRAAERDLQSAQRTHRDVKRKLDRVMNK